MLAGTALAPAYAQVANLGGQVVSRNDFQNFVSPGVGITPSEITNGTLRINPLSPQDFSGDLTNSSGVFSLIKFGTQALTLSGVNTYSGGTTVQGGRLILGSATALSATSRLSLNGTATTRSTVDLNGFSSTALNLTGNATGVVTSTGGPATLTVNVTLPATVYRGALQGNLALVKTGTGRLDLFNDNILLAPSNFTGGVTLQSGTLRVGSDLALGTGTLTVTGASSLGTTSNDLRTLNNNIVLQNRLTLDQPEGRQLVLNGEISGSGRITRIGVGLDLYLNGVNTYSGGTTLSGGQLIVGNNSALGTGDVTQTQTSIIAMGNPGGSITLANNFIHPTSALQISRPNDGGVFTFSGTISGAANIQLINPLAPQYGTGGGTVRLTGSNSLTGLLRVQSAGTLELGSAAAINSMTAVRIESNGALIRMLSDNQTITTRMISMINGGPLATTLDVGAFNLDFAGALRDGSTPGGNTLAITKIGTGILTVSNADTNPFDNNIISGGLFVTEGTLNLTGGMTNAIAVSSGATLTGTGFQNFGTVTIADGATLSPGDAFGGPNAIGTLSFANLTLGNLSNTIFDLGVPSIDVVASPNDLIIVNGNLALGGTFNFNILPGFAAGNYRLMTYAGALSGGVTLGVLPAGYNFTLRTSGGFIDLNVALADYYWDGNGPPSNGAVNGGNGTWNSGNTNWTDLGGNASIGWQNDAPAYFTAAPGAVAVDGDFTYSTLFFTVGGYVLNPAAGATLGADAGTIDVATGSATINVDLVGTGGLSKDGAGTLVLGGTNSFTGGLLLNAGTVTVTNAAALGIGTLSMADGTTLAAGANGLVVGNDVALTGVNTIDTGANIFTLSGTLADTVVAGGVFAGAWQVNDGPSWSGSPPDGPLAYTGQEAAALLFGGSPGDYVTSTAGSDPNLVNNLAWYATIGFGEQELAQDYSSKYLGLYYGPTVGYGFSADGPASAYVSDNSSRTNYAFVDAAVVPGQLVKIGSGTLILQGANSYSGGTLLTVGRIQVEDNLALGTGDLTMAGGTTLAAGLNNLDIANDVITLGVGTVDIGANIFTMSGVIAGAGSITKIGSGTLVLSVVNSYSGGTNLNAGTIRVGDNDALSTGLLTMAAGTSLQAGAASLNVTNAIAMQGGALVDVNGELLSLGGVISGSGPLSVIDSAAVSAAALVLSGVNTYTGGTVVTGTTLQVNENANLGNAAGGITLAGGTLRTTTSFATARAVTLGIGGGTLNVDIGTTLTTTGVLSGTSLTKAGGGVLALNANSYVGGTALNAGSIVVGTNTALGSGALAMAGGATLTAGTNNLALTNAVSTAGIGTIDTGTNNFTLNGVVSGAGSVAKTGSGTLVLNRANIYTNGTALTAGTIAVGNSAALGTSALAMAGGTTLTAGISGLTTANNITAAGVTNFDSGAAPSVYTLSGVISGAGSVVKQGTGILTLAGASTYAGATTVAAGTLNVTGSLVSAVTVNAGTGLTGTGTVGALNVLAGGSVAPGAPGTTNVGTLTVSGAATLGGTYSVNVAGAASDRITAGGALTLGGNLVVASVTPPLFGQEFVIASGSSLTGTFASTSGLQLFGPAFVAVVNYTPTSALIRISPNSLVAIGNLNGALNDNPLEAALAFDRAVANDYNPQAFLAVYSSGANMPRTLREILGEQRATERRVVLDSNRVIRETALDRLNLGLASMAGQQVSTGDGDSALTFWLRGAGSWGTANTSGAATSFTTQQMGLLTGIDLARDSLTVGGMFHYTTTDVTFGTLGGSSRVETVGGTAYAGWRQQDVGFVINGGASVAGARTSGNRAVTLTGFTQSLAGRTTGTTYQLFAELAFDLARNANTRVEPFVRNSYVAADMSALAETGGVAALAAPRQTLNINVLNVGMRASTTMQGGKLSLNASASLQQTSGAREAATFIGIPALGQFANIRSVSIDPTALLVQTGIAANLTDKIRLGVDYSGLFGKLNGDHGGRATLNFAF